MGGFFYYSLIELQIHNGGRCRLSRVFLFCVQGGFPFASAVFLFVVGAADEVVAGDVEAGVGGVEC